MYAVTILSAIDLRAATSSSHARTIKVLTGPSRTRTLMNQEASFDRVSTSTDHSAGADAPARAREVDGVRERLARKPPCRDPYRRFPTERDRREGTQWLENPASDRAAAGGVAPIGAVVPVHLEERPSPAVAGHSVAEIRGQSAPSHCLSPQCPPTWLADVY